MADYSTEGYKIIKCNDCGHSNTVLLQITGFKCQNCDKIILSEYFGTINGEFH